MITNKRGISPLIATVLLVGFTIVLAVVVINFVFYTTGGQTQRQSCDADAQQKCLGFVGESIGIGVTTGATPDIQVTNLGSEQADFIVTLKGSSGQTIGTPARLIALPIAASATTSGNFSGTNTTGLVTSISVIPITAGISDDGLLTCSATCSGSAKEQGA